MTSRVLDALTLNASSKASAFGETLVTTPTTRVSLKFPYNISISGMKFFSSTSASVVVAGNVLKCSTGAAAFSVATAESFASLNSRPGNGSLARFSALFTQGVAGAIQVAGIGNGENGLFFAYTNEDFGVVRRFGGQSEIQELEITAAATGSDSITVTLNSEALVVPILIGDSTAEIVTKIIATDRSGLLTPWEFTNKGSILVARALNLDVAPSGTYAYAAATTGSAGTWTQIAASVAPTNDFVAQDDWNGDTLQLPGSKFQLDPTAGNIYQIKFQGLGYGAMSFYVEDPDTGLSTLVHRIPYANSDTFPSMSNPSLPFSSFVLNTTNSTDISLEVSSVGMAIEGGTGEGIGNFRAAIKEDATALTTETPIITIENDISFSGRTNYVTLKLSSLIFACGDRAVTFRVYAGLSLTGPVDFQPVLSIASSVVADTAATGFDPNTGTLLLVQKHLAETSETFQPELDLPINPGVCLTITMQRSLPGGTALTTAGFNWLEII